MKVAGRPNGLSFECFVRLIARVAQAVLPVSADFPLTFTRDSWSRKASPLPTGHRQLILEMAAGNATRGEDRIASELALRLGIRVAPRTVKQCPHNRDPVRAPDPEQRRLSVVRNHSKLILTRDFFVVVTIALCAPSVIVIRNWEGDEFSTSKWPPTRPRSCPSRSNSCTAEEVSGRTSG